MNSVQLVGRISQKFELREYGKKDQKTSVIVFNVAINRSEDVADFIPVKAFNKTAALIDEYFNKGDQIIVSASLRSGSYENDDGDTVYTLEVVADRVEFGAKKLEEAKKEKGGKRGK